jgi:hypothetical protein
MPKRSYQFATAARVVSHSRDKGHVTSFTRLRLRPTAKFQALTLLSILHMDAPLDEASTSDAEEREILEAAHSGLYWDRVVSTRHLDLHPHNAFSVQGDDM